MSRISIILCILTFFLRLGNSCASDNGLIAYYDCDQLIGNKLLDKGPNGYHGTAHGSPRIVKIGDIKALQLDGVNDWVNCGSPQDFRFTNNSLTYELWLRADPSIIPCVIMGKRYDCSLSIWSDSELHFPYIHPDYCSGPLVNNAWVHVVGTYNGQSCRIYVNGRLKGHAKVTGGISANDSRPFRIGMQTYTDVIPTPPPNYASTSPFFNNYFKGEMDEIKIYNRALSKAEVETHYANSKDKYALTIRCFPYYFNQEIAVEITNLSPGCPLEIKLTKQGQNSPVLTETSYTLYDNGFAEARLNVGDLEPGTYELTAYVCQGCRKICIGREIIVWPERPSWPNQTPQMKVLNNFVTELLSIEIPADANYPFINPRKGWVFISSIAQTNSGEAKVFLDTISTTNPILLHQDGNDTPLENMRFLSQGQHNLRIETTGSAEVTSLLVRTVPELIYNRILDQPGVPVTATCYHHMWGQNNNPHNPEYTWNYLAEHVLPHCNTIVGNRTGCPFLPATEVNVIDWKAAGGKALYETGLPGRYTSLSPEDICQAWLNDPAYTVDLIDGALIDELQSYSEEKFDNWTAAVNMLWQSPGVEHKQFIPYLPPYAYYNPHLCDFVNLVINRPDGVDGFVAIESQMYEVSQPQLRGYLDGLLRRNILIWEGVIPGITQSAIRTLYYPTNPFYQDHSLNCRVDWKVFMDYQMFLMANDPAYWKLYGVMHWNARMVDEEYLRWQGRLYRHYAIEGNTSLLSEQYGYLYEPKHLDNPDFVDDFTGWNIVQGDSQTIQIRTIDHYETFLGARSPGIVQNESRVLWLKKYQGQSNMIQQQIKNLVPGKLYCLTLYVGDYRDLMDGVASDDLHPINISLGNVDIIADKSYCFVYWTEAANWGDFTIGDGGLKYWCNFHHKVFRANTDQTTLSIDDVIGQTDQELIINFIEIQPYFEN